MLPHLFFTSLLKGKQIIWLFFFVSILSLFLEGRSFIGSVFQSRGNNYFIRALLNNRGDDLSLLNAEANLERAVSFDPLAYPSYRSLGEVRTLQGDEDGAKQAFFISRTDPRNHTLQMIWGLHIGYLFLQKGLYEEAKEIQDITAAVSLVNRSTPELSCESKAVQLGLGNAWRLGNEGDIRAAEEGYLLVTAVSPGCAEGYYRLGDFYYEQQRFQDAIAAYQQGIKVDKKELARGYSGLGRSFLDLNQLDQAKEAAEAALRYGGWDWPHFLLGRIYQLKGDLRLANQNYSLVIEPEIYHSEEGWATWFSYFYLGWMAFDRQDLDMALSYLEKASRVMPGTTAEPQALYYVGQVYHQTKQLKEAISMYKRALSHSPASWDWVWSIHSALADAYRDNGQLDAAILEYKEVVRLNPSYEHAQKEIERLLVSR